MAALKKFEIDECSDFPLGRYISTNEDMWRILEYNIHEHYPAIIRLNVHLENQEYIYFDEDNIINIINNPKDTQLTAFFNLCRVDSFEKH